MIGRGRLSITALAVALALVGTIVAPMAAFAASPPTYDSKFNSTFPYAIAVDSAGNKYVSDGNNSCVYKYNSAGSLVATWDGLVSGATQFSAIFSIAVDSSDNVYVGDIGNANVQKFTSGGAFVALWDGSAAGATPFVAPWGIAVDSSNNVFVGDTDSLSLPTHGNVQKFTSGGAFVTKWDGSVSGATAFVQPGGIAVDSSDNVYVMDAGTSLVQKFTSAGSFVTKWDGSAGGATAFTSLAGIAVDSSNNVYVSDIGNNFVQKFTSAGVFVSKWGGLPASSANGQFNQPTGMAFDSSGNVYVADQFNDRVQLFKYPTPVSTPASSPWSLALAAVTALGVAVVSGRLRARTASSRI